MKPLKDFVNRDEIVYETDSMVEHPEKATSALSEDSASIYGPRRRRKSRGANPSDCLRLLTSQGREGNQDRLSIFQTLTTPQCSLGMFQ